VYAPGYYGYPGVAASPGLVIGTPGVSIGIGIGGPAYAPRYYAPRRIYSYPGYYGPRWGW
jgi:hypothetical protein